MLLGTALLDSYVAANIVGGNPMVGPCSIDLTLGAQPARLIRPRWADSSLSVRRSWVDSDTVPSYYSVGAPPKAYGETGLLLPPGGFALMAVAEKLTIPSDLCGELVGKSTWARKGLIVECAGLCDPGYVGCPTLELANIGQAALFLRPGDYIVQLVLHRVEGLVIPYSGRYQGDEGPQGAR